MHAYASVAAIFTANAAELAADIDDMVDVLYQLRLAGEERRIIQAGRRQIRRARALLRSLRANAAELDGAAVEV